MVLLSNTAANTAPCYAASALGSLVNGSDERANIIITAGSLPPLVALLSHASDFLPKHAAAKALTDILAASRDDLRSDIIAAGGLPELIRNLLRDWSPCKAAARLVNYLAAGTNAHRSAIIAAGSLPTLVRLLSGSWMPEKV